MKSVWLVLALVFSEVTFAAQSEMIFQPYLSSRMMGRGGTMTSVGDSFETIFFNPAGLARFEKHDLNLQLSLAATPSILNFYSDLGAAGSSAASMQTVITNHVGDHYASRVGLGMVLVWPSWGFALMPVDMNLELDVRIAGVGVQAYQDTVFVFAKAWNLNDEKTLNVGIAPKIVYRGYIEKDLTVFDLVTGGSSNFFQPSDAQEGLAIDTDLGAMYTPKVPTEGWFKWMKHAKPTFGLAIRNVIDGGFGTNLHLFSATSARTSTKLERRFDLGARFDIEPFWVFTPRAMIEFRDMGSRYASFKKSMHIGFELFWKAFSWLEGNYSIGYSQGYLTFGVSGQVSVFRIDLSTFGEELGSFDSPRESRRWMAKLSLDF